MFGEGWRLEWRWWGGGGSGAPLSPTGVIQVLLVRVLWRNHTERLMIKGLFILIATHGSA